MADKLNLPLTVDDIFGLTEVQSVQPPPRVQNIPGYAPPRPRVVPQQNPPSAQTLPPPPRPVQAQPPVQAPAQPQAQPQPAPQQPLTVPPMPERQAPPASSVDELFAPLPRPQAAPRPADPNAEPDASSWLGRRWQDIKGKQDQRYKDLPALADTGAVNIGDDNVSRLTMPDDHAYGDILSKSLADGVTMTRRFRDANGYEIIGFKYQDGPEQLAYVNKPGLDTHDVDRVVSGSLPFMAGGAVTGAAAKGLALLGRVAAQSAAAAGVATGQEIALENIGSEQKWDWSKVGGAAAGGAVGELAAPAIGAFIRKFVTEPSLFDKATGKLTEKGAEAAKASGFDPASMTREIQQEFAKLLARTKDARAAGVGAELGDLGIPTTLGQRTKDVAQLTREQEMRDGVWGEAASRAMKEFDQRQWDAMVKALMGEIEPGKPGMSLLVNPARSPADYTPGQIGAGIAERSQMAISSLRKQEADMWRSVGRIEPTDKALTELPHYIGNALGDMAPSEHDVALMPVTTSILKQAKAFMEKQPPKQAVDGFLPNAAVADVNKFRMSIGAKIGEMEKGTDRNAARRVYDGVNEWIREMAERNMLTASNADAATAAANMVAARGITSRIHSLLEAGGNKAGAAILKQVLETADSPEQVVRALFVGPTAKSIKPGSITAIQTIKKLAGEIGDEGTHLMNDMRLAYWLQIVRNPAGKEGENIFNPQTLLRNLRQSADSQRSVWHTLFTPEQIAMRNRIIHALENGPTFHDWTIKPNSSRSGTTIARMFTDMLGTLVGAPMAKTVTEAGRRASGLSRAGVYGATVQTPPARNPHMIGKWGSVLGAEYGSRSE